MSSMSVFSTEKIGNSVPMSHGNLIMACCEWEADLIMRRRPASMRELAEAWDMSEPAIRAYKAGIRTVPVDRLLYIHKRYRVDWNTIGKYLLNMYSPSPGYELESPLEAV